MSEQTSSEQSDSVRTTEGEELHVAIIRGTVVIQAIDGNDDEGLYDVQLDIDNARLLGGLLLEASVEAKDGTAHESKR